MCFLDLANRAKSLMNEEVDTAAPYQLTTPNVAMIFGRP
jgi:hypothetical protein